MNFNFFRKSKVEVPENSVSLEDEIPEDEIDEVMAGSRRAKIENLRETLNDPRLSDDDKANIIIKIEELEYEEQLSKEHPSMGLK